MQAFLGQVGQCTGDLFQRPQAGNVRQPCDQRGAALGASQLRHDAVLAGFAGQCLLGIRHQGREGGIRPVDKERLKAIHLLRKTTSQVGAVAENRVQQRASGGIGFDLRQEGRPLPVLRLGFAKPNQPRLRAFGIGGFRQTAGVDGDACQGHGRLQWIYANCGMLRAWSSAT